MSKIQEGLEAALAHARQKRQREALEAIGGEPLENSGFENEVTDASAEHET
jgi:hypothetical protein